MNKELLPDTYTRSTVPVALILFLLVLFIGPIGAETQKKAEPQKIEPAANTLKKEEPSKPGTTKNSGGVKKTHKDCTNCHIEKDSAVLKGGINETCIQCHPQSVKKDHVIDVVPQEAPADLPLGEGNKMTCITCHEPHGKNTVGKLLRKESNSLCISCHKDI